MTRLPENGVRLDAQRHQRRHEARGFRERAACFDMENLDDGNPGSLRAVDQRLLALDIGR